MLTSELRTCFSVGGAVANGKRLVEAALASMPDVIVSDVNMPVLGGLEAMLALRDLGRDIPFVMVSADAGAADECLARGAAAFVAKLDVGRDLVLAVLAVLSGRTYVSSSVRESRSAVRPLGPTHR